MELKINDYKMGERPDVTIPVKDFLKQLGEEGIRKMVSRHYDLMRVSDIKHLFPESDVDFENAKLHSSDFMIQICGGPDYFNQHRGKPMMINRHAPFKITPQGRIVWLTCYSQALIETGLTEPLIRSFWEYINVFSAWMVNAE
jgi:hemoglobin